MKTLLKALFLLLLLVLVVLLWRLHQAGVETASTERLQSADMMAWLPAEGETFAAHRQRLTVWQQRFLPAEADERWLDWRLPFEQLPEAGCDPAQDRGVLFLHGLTDSPFSLRDVAASLAADCQTVRVLLLPGHGTVPGHLRTARIDDWQTVVDRGVAEFRRSHPQFLLGGYSLGSALALDYTRRHPEALPSALILISPALALDSPWAWILPLWDAASRLFPRLAWLELYEDSNPVKYESFPVNAARQMLQLAESLNAVDAAYPALPVWSSLAAADATVDAPASLRLLCRVADAKHSRFLWYDAAMFEPPCAAVQMRKPGEGVLDYSHVALPFSPGNPVYGKEPLYFSCNHYPPATASWRLCKGLDRLEEQLPPALGEVTQQNRERYPLLRRLTYHPDFAAMMDDMRGFLGTLPVRETQP